MMSGALRTMMLTCPTGLHGDEVATNTTLAYFGVALNAAEINTKHHKKRRAALAGAG
jgi:hypothetical protein